MLHNLFLIGYRGTGKSAVARLVAERLGCPWLDADVELERRAGRSIADLFAAEGEPAFRDLESQLLDELSRTSGQVLALGGGVVLREENRRLLASRGRTAWLTAPPETLWQRIGQDATTAARRPNLTAGGGLAEIEQILAERLPLYRQTADWVVDTDRQTPAEVAGQLVALVQQHSAASRA